MLVIRAVATFAAHPVACILLLAQLGNGNAKGVDHALRKLSGDRFLDRLMVRLAAERGIDQIVVDRGESTWRTDIGDEISLSLLRDGEYEGDEIRAVLRWLREHRPTGTVVDLGANVGTTSIPVARAGYRVLAIEPVPATFAMLSENVETNGVAEQVACVQVAIAEEAGTVSMWTGCSSGQAEVAVPGKDPALLRWGERGEQIKVRSRPLDSLLSESGVQAIDIAMVWCDVQGSETAVVATGRRLWDAGVPLWLEVDPLSLDLHGTTERFIALVVDSFGTFAPRESLLKGAPLRSIGEFPAWVATIGSNRYSDALLIPRHQ